MKQSKASQVKLDCHPVANRLARIHYKNALVYQTTLKE
jgi:hypothetical protein